jgi:sporulation protein YunB
MAYEEKLRAIFSMLVVALFIACIFAIVVRRNFAPLAEDLAKTKVSSAASLIINDSVVSEISRTDMKYSDLEEITKTSNGTISGINTNIAQFNLFKSNITKEIEQRLDKADLDELGVNVGSIVLKSVFCGRGPKIPVKYLSLNSLEAKLNNEFSSCGINQTCHEVMLDVKVDIKIVLPLTEATTQVSSEIPLVSTIIVGDVPDVYAKIEQQK